MAEIVNLRRAKKAKARASAEDEAAVNRARHGTPKRVRELTKARSEKTARDLEAGRLDPGKDPETR
jgi:hypothetical protein